MSAALRSLSARTAASSRSSVTPPPAWLRPSRAASSVTCRSRSARRRAFSMATAAWSARTPRSRSSSSEKRSRPRRERTTTPMTRPSERSGARSIDSSSRSIEPGMSMARGSAAESRTLRGWPVAATQPVMPSPTVTRRPAADSPRYSRRVRPEGHRLEGPSVLVEHVHARVVEGHDTLGVGAQRGTDLLDVRQPRELRGHVLDGLELRRPGDGTRPETRDHGADEAPRLDAGECQVVFAEGFGAPTLEDQQAAALVGQGQVGYPSGPWTRGARQPAPQSAATGARCGACISCRRSGTSGYRPRPVPGRHPRGRGRAAPIGQRRPPRRAARARLCVSAAGPIIVMGPAARRAGWWLRSAAASGACRSPGRRRRRQR